MKQIGGVLIMFIFLITSCSKQEERIKPTFSEITESVYASATVKAVNQYTVYSTVNGLIKDIKVHPGDKVNAGDPLFILDDNAASLNTENSRLVLELSEGNNNKKLQELELNVRLAREKYLLDSSLYVRQKTLWQQNIGAKVDLEQRHLAYTSSKNSYKAALSQLSQLKTQLKNELERAKVNYNISRKFQSDYVIKSDVNGKIFDVLKDQGELITTQTPLAIIGKESFTLEMNVDENDIARIRLGQRVEIVMDSYKGQVFEGVVDKIYPIMNESSRTFQVDARFLNPPPVLYPNLTAEANIIIQTKKKAVIIPRSYLENDKYVWIAEDEKREVKTGLKDYRKIEIVQGLDTSEFIYKPK